MSWNKIDAYTLRIDSEDEQDKCGAVIIRKGPKRYVQWFMEIEVEDLQKLLDRTEAVHALIQNGILEPLKKQR